MKKKIHFISHCVVGFLLILVIFFIVVMTRSQNGIEGNLNILAFIAPLIFIPLLVMVVYQKKHNYYQKLLCNKEKGCYKKGFCVFVVGGLLTFVTFISAIIIYYGW